MLAIAIEFLTGRYAAAAFNDRDLAEWPPHPVRLFAALVSAWADGGKDDEERRALEWLERQGAPSLCASEGYERPVRTTFVPVNDTKQSRGVLPSLRSRQPRTFPSFAPIESTAFAVWTDARSEDGVRTPLERLLARVSYLGHSSSLVSLSLVDEAPAATHVPVEATGDIVLRVPAAGQLEALERAHAVYEKARIKGQLPCRFQPYARARSVDWRSVAEGVFGDMVVYRRRAGSRLPLEAAEVVAETLRRAVISVSEEPVSELVSGHRIDGTRSERPHVAYVGLPSVAHRHSDGQLLGVAAVLPRSLDVSERAGVLRALSGVTRLTMGRVGTWDLERATAETLQMGLQAQTWTRPSRRWASVTPVELDVFPSEPYGGEAAEIVARSCSRTDLPSPSQVVVGPDSIVPGVPPWRSFAASRRAHPRVRRPLVHVVVDFDDLVRGPVLLGAGRYRGLGLCRPVRVSSP